MQVSFYIDEREGKELDALAIAAGQSRAEFFRDILKTWLALPDGFELPKVNS